MRLKLVPRDDTQTESTSQPVSSYGRKASKGRALVPCDDTQTEGRALIPRDDTQTESPSTPVSSYGRRIEAIRLSGGDKSVSEYKRCRAVMSRIRMSTLSGTKKEKHNELSRRRMQEYRRRKKEQLEHLKSKTLTRKEAETLRKKQQEQREKWKKEKQLYRQKKKDIERKQDDTVSDTSIDNSYTEQQCEQQDSSYSRSVIRGAKFRVRKVLPKDKALSTIVLNELLIEFSPSLKVSGIVSSPQTASRRNSCEVVVGRIADTEKILRRKRDPESLARRKLLLNMLVDSEECVEESTNKSEDSIDIEHNCTGEDMEIQEVPYEDWLHEIKTQQNKVSTNSTVV